MAQVLKKGGIFIANTDTIPGVFCSPFDTLALERIFALKGRDARKPMAIYTLKPEELAEVPQILEALIKKAPITFVLPVKPDFAAELGASAKYIIQDGCIGIRTIQIGEYPILAGTSANFSGTTSPINLRNVSPEFAKKVDFVMEGVDGCGAESSVIKFNPDGSVEVLRKGYNFIALEPLLKSPSGSKILG